MEKAVTETDIDTEARVAEGGLKIERRFTTEGVDPFSEVTWEERDAVIGDPASPAFEQRGVEFPDTWSQNATNIVAQKYFRGPLGSPERERSVKQMIGRVAGTIAEWGREGGYFATPADAQAFEDELTHILLHQKAAFNSPVWFNVGFEEHPQCSACFILSVEDTMESILAWNTKEGQIFRGGSGSGINLSNIRGSSEQLSKGGYASGPVSFMRGADAWAGTIKSGGKTRRAAKMVVLDIDHPDIEDFIWCKAKEEDKAAALRDAGFDMSIDGEGFTSIQYQNANNSVRISDEFMEAVEADSDWDLTARKDGSTIKTLPARDLLEQLSEAAWRCADPGVQFDTIINDWHTCPESGRINASNPCSEYMHVDDSACNLASINLMKYRREDGSFNTADFEHTVDTVLLAQEIVVSPSSYPTEGIGTNARRFRQLGLGYANLGAFLMSNGMPYDSEDGRAVAASITALMTGRGYRKSAEIAAAMGPYDEYAKNREPHNRVMRMHRDASHDIAETHITDRELLDAARRSWDEAVALGDEHGYRNAQATVLAPTGTISFLMDCDTTGIEPDFSLVKYKELVGGGSMTIVNRSVPLALRTLGYTDEGIEQITAFINEKSTIVGAPGLEDGHLPVFDVAVGERAISHMGHIQMMSATQPFLSGAISKTVNLPETATVADIADAQAFEDELTHILLHQKAAFNSPVWFNVGFEEHPQCSACFILSVEDTMESILAWNTKEGQIFRGGSGSGINLSNIRGSSEQLSKGGYASGPVSFMRGADAWAGTIKSGGKTRRAAKMVVLDIRPIRTSRTSSGARPRRRTRRQPSATPASTCRSTARASPRSSTRTRTTRFASATSSWRPSRPTPTGT